MLVRYLCLHCRGGKDALIEICNKATADLPLLADLLSGSQVSGATELASCDSFFRPLECLLFILSCIGDVAVNDFDNLLSASGSLPGKFSSALSNIMSSPAVGGSNRDVIMWCQRWLSISLNATASIKSCADRVTFTNTSNGNLRSVIYMLKEQLVQIWGAAPFFVRTLHAYLGTLWHHIL